MLLKKIAVQLTMLGLCLSLVLGSMAVIASPASAEEPQAASNELVTFCREVFIPLVEAITGVEISLGACVSTIRSEAESAAAIASICQTEEGRALVEAVTGQEVTTVGECIQVVRAFVGPAG